MASRSPVKPKMKVSPCKSVLPIHWGLQAWLNERAKKWNEFLTITDEDAAQKFFSEHFPEYQEEMDLKFRGEDSLKTNLDRQYLRAKKNNLISLRHETSVLLDLFDEPASWSDAPYSIRFKYGDTIPCIDGAKHEFVLAEKIPDYFVTVTGRDSAHPESTPTPVGTRVVRNATPGPASLSATLPPASSVFSRPNPIVDHEMSDVC